MIAELARGFGIQAFGDPMPAPGTPRGLSYSPGQAYGRIRLVGTKGGRAREATYQEIYFANPFVYAATNYIARGIGQLPLHLFRLEGNGEKVRIRGDVPTRGPNSTIASLDRVLNTPEGRISRSAFYAGTVRQRIILGNGLWEILRDGRQGEPTGLRRIPWQMVTHVQEDSYGMAEWYELRERGIGAQRRQLARDDVVHFGLGSEGDQACGVSVLESCSATIALHDAMMRHLLGYAENAMRPSGHFQIERGSKEKMKEIRELMSEMYASPENAGRILVTTGQWQPMGDSPDHAHLVQLIKESRIEIAAAFQTPPPVLGLLDNAIRANVKEMREQYGRDTLGPWATETEDELEAQLIQPYYPNTFTEFQLAEKLRPDLEARALVYQRLMWVMSIDEIRTIENLPALKIAGVTDVPWVASGAAPVTVASKPKTPVAPTPPDRPGNGNGAGDDQALAQVARALALFNSAEHHSNGHTEGYNHDDTEVLSHA